MPLAESDDCAACCFNTAVLHDTHTRTAGSVWDEYCCKAGETGWGLRTLLVGVTLASAETPDSALRYSQMYCARA